MIPVLTVVPWFSRQEWIDVYKAVFSDDISRWKDAKDTMIVWQARVNKLPAGIDVTLPLLEAKIVGADPTIENSVKSIMLATAVQRFVSSIVKLPQTKYYHQQTMHDLASEIELPIHLVDLRNEIIHGSGGWAGGQTVQKALDTACDWIKSYYWDDEWKKMQKSPEESSVPQIPQDEWQKFLKLLQFHATLVIPESRTAKFKNKFRKKACLDLVKTLEKLYPQDPQECMTAIVSHLLVPEAMPNLIERLQPNVNRPCGCFFERDIISGVDHLISSLHMVEGSTELLVSCLIKKGYENPKVASEWIRVLAGSILGISVFYDQSTTCRRHTFNLDTTLYVKWQPILLELLEVEAEWATDIATRILNCPTAGFTEPQKTSIMELLQILKGTNIDDSEHAEKSLNNVKDGVYTIDDIAEIARGHSEKTLAKMERFKNSVAFPGAVVTDVDAPLGVLAHQRENPVFYKELLLPSPDTGGSPMPKRRKT
ncbi:uncharacterized protein [Procambarus clarkii]|uniref:uncharacterized protein n=1 Tax=Procambarus clarkii TaxID=6728 RepID=UPI003742F48C